MSEHLSQQEAAWTLKRAADLDTREISKHDLRESAISAGLSPHAIDQALFEVASRRHANTERKLRRRRWVVAAATVVMILAALWLVSPGGPFANSLEVPEASRGP